MCAERCRNCNSFSVFESAEKRWVIWLVFLNLCLLSIWQWIFNEDLICSEVFLSLNLYPFFSYSFTLYLAAVMYTCASTQDQHGISVSYGWRNTPLTPPKKNWNELETFTHRRQWNTVFKPGVKFLLEPLGHLGNMVSEQLLRINPEGNILLFSC